MGWTGSRNSTCTCSASSRPRGTARSWTSAGGASAPCWRGWSSSGTRWCRPISSSTASGATTRPPTRNGALQAYVSHLRRRLEPDATARQRDGVIARAGPGYVLRLAPDAVDAWAFEAAVESAAGQAPGDAVCTLETALRMWRGPAYADYAGEAWAEAEVARLTELRGVARERLLATRLELGEAQLVIGDLEALVKEDPLREERWRLLTLALYRSHRQAAALEALRRARDGARRRARRRPGSRPARARGGGARPVAGPRRADARRPPRTRPHSIPRPRTPDGLVDRDARWPS